MTKLTTAAKKHQIEIKHSVKKMTETKADRPMMTPSIYARFTLETKTGASVAIK
jgi:hypothetical protein